MVDEEAILGIGRLTAGGPWVGLRRAASRWDLVFSDDGAFGNVRAQESGPDRRGLVAAAIAYFSEAVVETPPAHEATQADLASMIRWLAETESDESVAARLREALDGVDDGLAGDVVAGRLWVATANEQIDPIDLLVELDQRRTHF